MRILKAFIIFFLSFGSISSQENIQIGLIGGGTLFQGDYPSYRLKDTFSVLVNPGFGFFIRKAVNDAWSFKASFYFTSFSGDDRLDPALTGLRNPGSFKFPAGELLLTAEYAPLHFDLFGRSSALYILGGAGFSKTTYKNFIPDDACPIVNLILPVGAGIRTKINDLLTFSFQIESIHALSDCLEGVKGITNTKDVYKSIKIGLSYGLTSANGSQKGKAIGCPTF